MISYRVLFARAVSRARAFVARLVLSAEAETRIDEWIAGLAPGDAQLEESIGRALANTGTVASITGLVALVGLPGRRAGWRRPSHGSCGRLGGGAGTAVRPREIVDLALVFVGVALVLAAFVANVSMQLITTYGAELAERLGLERVDARMLGAVGQSLAALAITIAALLVLYRLSPNCPPLRELLPGAIVGGIAAHLAILGFSLYVGLMASFEELYGTLGSLFGFLFLVYLSRRVSSSAPRSSPLGGRPPAHAGPKARRCPSASGSSTRRGASSGRRAIRRPSRADGNRTRVARMDQPSHRRRQKGGGGGRRGRWLLTVEIGAGRGEGGWDAVLMTDRIRLMWWSVRGKLAPRPFEIGR